MAVYNKFQDFVEAVMLGQHNMNTDQLMVYLSNVAPDAALDADKADLAEIAIGNGYTGPRDILNAMSEAGGIATVTAVDQTFTAAGGPVGPFQYAVIFNQTHVTDGLVGWYDYGAPVTLQDGEDFTVDFGAALQDLQ